MNSLEKPLVSVIMPVYNSASYLRKALDSVLNQTYPNIEIIVVNDGSKDDSLTILDSEYEGLPNVKIFHRDNKGQCSACNFGFQNSKGDYVKFFDSDDILNEIFIEEQIRLLKGSKTELSSASWGRFYEDDLSKFSLENETVWRDLDPMDWLIEALESGKNMMQCGLWLIPRELLLKSGLWNESLSVNNDFEFFIRVILQSSRIRYSSKSILYYRSGLVNSLSKQRSDKSVESSINAILLGSRSILNVENSERTRVAVGKNILPWLFMTYCTYPSLGNKLESLLVEIKFKMFTSRSMGVPKIFIKIMGWKLFLRFKHWVLVKMRFRELLIRFRRMNTSKSL